MSIYIGILISCVDDLSMSTGAFDLLRSQQVLFHIAFVIFSAILFPARPPGSSAVFWIFFSTQFSVHLLTDYENPEWNVSE